MKVCQLAPIFHSVDSNFQENIFRNSSLSCHWGRIFLPSVKNFSVPAENRATCWDLLKSFCIHLCLCSFFSCSPMKSNYQFSVHFPFFQLLDPKIKAIFNFRETIFRTSLLSCYKGRMFLPSVGKDMAGKMAFGLI